MKSRATQMGLLLGLTESVFLLSGLFGTLVVPLIFGLSGFPVLSFWIAYKLNDLESTIKALLLSQLVNISLFLLLLFSAPSYIGTLFDWYKPFPFFFSILYFLFAMVGSLGGYIAAEWTKDEVPLPKAKWALEKFMRDRDERKSKREG